MLPYKRSAALIGWAACLSISSLSCANSPTGKAIEQSLAADPRLKDNPVLFAPSPTASISPSAAVTELSDNFPIEIPRYPNAQIQEVKPIEGDAGEPGQMARWTSSDASDRVQNFYRQQFQQNNWQIVSQPTDSNKGSFLVRRDNLQVKVFVEPSASQNSANGTTLIIKYLRAADEIASPQPNPSPTTAIQPSPNPTANITTAPTPTPTASAGSESFTDLNKVPTELRQYVADMAELGVLTPDAASAKNKPSDASAALAPNKTITRREYARWLVAANNQIYANQPARKIRLGLETAQPNFQDVPVKDPDFAAIQGLAEAGIVASSLTGESTEVLFRPDAPLTREQLLQWKLPLDTRRSLPTASLEAVQQTWGFQDATKIDPKALRAVLADFQNGDLANIRRAFGYTTLFQPKKSVTRAEAAAALWYFGFQGEGLSAKDSLQAKTQAN